MLLAHQETRRYQSVGVDFVRSLVASPPTIETFTSSGWSPGNQHSPGRHLTANRSSAWGLRANELSHPPAQIGETYFVRSHEVREVICPCPP